MSYDPTHPTIMDEIRFGIGDAHEDEADEVFTDVQYTAVLDRYDNWKRAYADMADAMAIHLDKQQTSFTATGDMAVGWSDRARTLRDRAKTLRREADEEDRNGHGTGVGMVVTVSQDFLTGGAISGGEW